MKRPPRFEKSQRLIIAGPIEPCVRTHMQSAPQHHFEDRIQLGDSLSNVFFSDDNPEITWLFTDASEAEIVSIGLDPELIDQWGVEIDEGCLPVSPEFKTIDACIAYLKAKIQPIWQAQLR